MKERTPHPLARFGQTCLFPLHHAGITFHEFRLVGA